MNVKFPFIRQLALSGLMFVTASLMAETVSLSSLDLKQMTTGWSDAKADLGVAGKLISIGGKQFKHGVGTHAASNFRVQLDGKATRFVCESRGWTTVPGVRAVLNSSSRAMERFYGRAA